MKKTPKKLSLNTSTIARLTDPGVDLALVHGGKTSSYTWTVLTTVGTGPWVTVLNC